MPLRKAAGVSTSASPHWSDFPSSPTSSQQSHCVISGYSMSTPATQLPLFDPKVVDEIRRARLAQLKNVNLDAVHGKALERQEARPMMKELSSWEQKRLATALERRKLVRRCQRLAADLMLLTVSEDKYDSTWVQLSGTNMVFAKVEL